MHKFAPVFAVLIGLLMNIQTVAQSASELAAIWEKNHISNIAPSNVRHRDLQKYLADLKSSGVKVEEVGRSYGNREIYQMEWGRGPMRVFMWSQMHGDEPTATSALVDMFMYLQKNGDKKLVKTLAEKFTIRTVPMLNPDGAELYQRRNLQGIDINRDARNLTTPEARLLKKLRDEWSPEIGFNLHNQNALTTAGRTSKQAAISFLAVLGDPNGVATPGWERNKRVISAMTAALNQFIPGHIGRYDDEFSPNAFGDNFSAWGTPTILIETGALHGKDEMFLIKMNFVAFLTALQSIADGSEQRLSAANYDLIPENTSDRVANFVFRGATVVNTAVVGSIPFVTDIAVNFERRRAETISPAFVRDVGGLPNLAGLEEFDARDFYLVPRSGNLRVGTPADFLLFRKSRTLDWKKTNEPDGIFQDGKLAMKSK